MNNLLKTDKIYCIDCLEGMKGIDSGSIDMILCDLPYGYTKCKWDDQLPFKKLWMEYKRIIKKTASIVLTATQPFTTDLINSNRAMWKEELIWNKLCIKNPGIVKYRHAPAHESIQIFAFAHEKTTYNPQFRKGKPYKDHRIKPIRVLNDNEHKCGFSGFKVKVDNNGYRYPISVFEIVAYNKPKQHPCQKPVALFEYLIKTYSNEGEIVLDNCIGSGTTAVACKRSNRHFIGFEIDKKYCNMANKRLNNIPVSLDRFVSLDNFQGVR